VVAAVECQFEMSLSELSELSQISREKLLIEKNRRRHLQSAISLLFSKI